MLYWTINYLINTFLISVKKKTVMVTTARNLAIAEYFVAHNKCMENKVEKITKHGAQIKK